MTTDFDNTGPPYPPPPGPGSNAIGVGAIGTMQIGDIPPFDIWETIQSQYANSPIITTLIRNFADFIDQTANFSAFFDLIMNVDTAVRYGLDVWGRIVGVNRIIKIVTPLPYFGFQESNEAVGFNQGPFYSGQTMTTSFTLTDEAYRRLILTKAFANISQCSIPMLNKMLLTLFPHRGNCFSGDTEILTDKGFMPLNKLRGSVNIMSPVSGRFEKAVAKSYGVQTLNKVTINNGSRGHARSGSFTCFVTPDHRWVLQDGSVTDHLKVGDILKAGHSAVESDPVGWVHGFIYGDGSRDREGEFRVRLCGPKDRQHLWRFLRAFPDATVRYARSYAGDPRVRIKTKIPMKELPTGGSSEYLRGFVEGLLAADGCFSTRGDDPFQFHGSEKTVRWMKDHLVFADFAPCGRAYACHDKPTNYGPRSAPLWKVHFRPVATHKGFRVMSIEAHDRQEVFCVEEPKYRQITLRNGLRSHNCYVTEGTTFGPWFGFKEATDAVGFNQAPFYAGQAIPRMVMTYTFEFQLSPLELAIVNNSGVMPKPTGVKAYTVILA